MCCSKFGTHCRTSTVSVRFIERDLNGFDLSYKIMTYFNILYLTIGVYGFKLIRAGVEVLITNSTVIDGLGKIRTISFFKT